MFELFLRLQPEPQHEDGHNQISKRFPNARFTLWCNSGTDIMEIEANGLETFEGLQEHMNQNSKKYNSKIISKTYLQDKFQLVARTCMCGGTPISPIIERHNFMRIEPIIFMDGWEYHRLVGFDDHDTRGLLKSLDRIGRTEILRKAATEGVTDDTFLLSLSSLFGQLTDKQTKALVSAIENGYYEIPKRVTAEELAKKNGQPRSTFEEHVRKAERKVLLAMAPFMMMYARVPASPFSAKTKAAGATVGARVMKQLVAVASKNRSPIAAQAK